MFKIPLQKVIAFIFIILLTISLIPSTGGIVKEPDLEARNISFEPNKFSGNILYVGGGGPGNYSRIQDAIDNASHGDTVFVFDDSSPYFENVVVNKYIELRGENKETTVIDGGGSGNVVYITWDGVTLTGFTIRYCGGSWSRSGILVHSSENHIYWNKIINNKNGIFLESTSHNVIFENTIENNGYHGIRIEYSSYNDIVGNNISNNEANGIYLWEATYTFISKNTIADSYLSGIIIGDYSEDNIIYLNNFIDNRQENAYDEWNNTWDSGYPSGGNYWDDYIGEDADGDGIGDTPYDIPGGDSQDRYPLMHPFGVITVEITKPEKRFIYISNNKFIPFLTTIIIGNIDIEVNAFEYKPGLDIERVEFYIDNDLKNTDTSHPYSWLWDEFSIFRHTLRIVAYNTNGENASKELVVWKFF
jgi:parallel beta-helix repeat protein